MKDLFDTVMEYIKVMFWCGILGILIKVIILDNFVYK